MYEVESIDIIIPISQIKKQCSEEIHYFYKVTTYTIYQLGPWQDRDGICTNWVTGENLIEGCLQSWRQV